MSENLSDQLRRRANAYDPNDDVLWEAADTLDAFGRAAAHTSKLVTTVALLGRKVDEHREQRNKARALSGHLATELHWWRENGIRVAIDLLEGDYEPAIRSVAEEMVARYNDDPADEEASADE